MSGHSKWANIRRKKEVVDAVRGKVFTRLGKEITIAARQGGGDESTNPRLRTAILSAKGANMPSTNIEKAIKKGLGTLEGVSYEEFVYEGYGPAGVAIIIEGVTDNKKRTVSEIRHLLTKHGGNLASSGSVSWMFETKGLIQIPCEGLDEDDVMMHALDAGAEDFEKEDDHFEIITQPNDLFSVQEALTALGYNVDSAQIQKIPNDFTEVPQDDIAKVVKFDESVKTYYYK